MTELEQFVAMLTRAGIRFQVRRQKSEQERKIVKVFGRFSSDQTMFKFDENGNLYFAGSFEEPSIHWSGDHGKFIGGKTVRSFKDLTETQREEYEQMYKGHDALKKS